MPSSLSHRVSAPAILGPLAAAALTVGCTTTLVPPTAVEDPVTALVLDHGYHTSLVLPTGADASVRYAYGDWRYFGLGRQGFISGTAALLWPTPGALGRRELGLPAEPEVLRGKVPVIREALAIDVARDRARALRRRLDARHEALEAEQVDNRAFALSFVPASRDYWLVHNSNHAIARWLAELGVSVRGWPVYARWRLARTAGTSDRQVP